MIQKDLAILSEEEMRQEGWTKLAPDHWQKRHGPYKIENYWGRVGQKPRGNSSTVSATLEKVIFTSRCWEAVINELTREWNGFETAVPILGERVDNYIVLHDAVPSTAPGDIRGERFMQLKDSAAERAEEYRLSNGWRHHYCASIHSHPVGSTTMYSDADSFAWGVRARKEVGGLFIGGVIVPLEGGSFRPENLRTYLTVPSAGEKERTAPISFEIEF